MYCVTKGVQNFKHTSYTFLNTEESTFPCTLALEHIARKVHDKNEHSTHVNFVNFTYLIQSFKDSI